MSKKQVSDLLNRAFHTFWQATLTYLLINADVLVDSLDSLEALRTAGVALLAGAIGAGLSALKSYIKETA